METLNLPTLVSCPFNYAVTSITSNVVVNHVRIGLRRGGTSGWSQHFNSTLKSTMNFTNNLVRSLLREKESHVNRYTLLLLVNISDKTTVLTFSSAVTHHSVPGGAPGQGATG